MIGIACAKLNLGLRVGATRGDGLHELSGIFQSIAWVDILSMSTETGEDGVAATTSVRGIPDGDANLAWRALSAVRDMAETPRPATLQLDKRIPVAAGLGGGSADAAVALAMSAELFGVDRADAAALAAGLGSDVPFCFEGGTAIVSGGGEDVTALDARLGYAVAVVVPPIETSTPSVYAAWDRLGGPVADPVRERSLPPELRELGRLANDLYPAAVDVAPSIDGWRSELEARFARPVLMSGSGSSLFAFFVDADEAADALEAVPVGARATWAGSPVPFGWAMRRDEGAPVTDSRGRAWNEDDVARWWIDAIGP